MTLVRCNSKSNSGDEHTKLMAATSSEGPTSKEVPLSAMALQPPSQLEAPGTFTLSMAICQYPRRVTGALQTPIWATIKVIKQRGAAVILSLLLLLLLLLL